MRRNTVDAIKGTPGMPCRTRVRICTTHQEQEVLDVRRAATSRSIVAAGGWQCPPGGQSFLAPQKQCRMAVTSWGQYIPVGGKMIYGDRRNQNVYTGFNHSSAMNYLWQFHRDVFDKLDVGGCTMRDITWRSEKKRRSSWDVIGKTSIFLLVTHS